MVFVVMFVVSWVLAFVLYSMKKSLSLVENVYVYLVLFSMGLVISWIVAEELKLIELTQEALPYTGYLLYRTIALPLVLVIMMNVIFKMRKAVTSVLSACIAIVMILSLDGLMLYNKAFMYKQWNLFYDALVIIALQVVGYCVLLLYRKSMKQEVKVL